MKPPPTSNPNPTRSSKEPCPGCQRWIGWYAELAREHRDLRAQLDRVDEDQVELIAHAHYRLYCMLGGSERTEGSYRAEVRAQIRAEGLR